MTLRLSSTRFFDFDEFQVLYASASLVRGKALYSDQIGSHFPLVNILLSFLIKVLGFKTATVLVARHFILFCLFTTLFFIFKVTEMIWNRAAGLLAVALTMVSIVFVDKGIEIRHDVFNMTFNTIGAYWALKYLKERKIYFLWLSGLFLGLALASTQKAVIWNLGIIVGLSFCIISEVGYVNLGKVLVSYLGTMMIPILVSLGYLLLSSSEGIKAFFDIAVVDAAGYFNPKRANVVYPFPYTKVYIYKDLLYENGLFFLFSITALLSSFGARYKCKSERALIAFWAGIGTLFYLLIKRPFHQSLLPTIPALGILVAGFLMMFRKRLEFVFWPKRVLLEALLMVLLLVWPCYLIAQKTLKSPTMKNQMKNISFCVENLDPQDKVLCFSQQQIYFDPLLRMSGDECGNSIYVMDTECFEREMIRKRCRVVINDHRTRFLNKEIKERIRDHFIYMGVGDILIPGFLVRPKSSIEREVWVPGAYYSPTLELMVDGQKIKKNLIDLHQKKYRFENPTSQLIILLYIFNREEFVKGRTKGIEN